jgi:A/G-specific adenine glycosylase
MVENYREVRKVMRSLGLRQRAEDLIKIARLICRGSAGEVPPSFEGLMSLPGVGDYVANAVMCFAFGVPAVLLDTNTRRVVTRVRGLKDPKEWEVRSELYDLAGPGGAVQDFNYALLDFAATVCRATKPLCDRCPVQPHCAWHHSRGKGPRSPKG